MSSGNSVEEKAFSMVTCQDCGRQVPSSNLAIHQVRACARRPSRRTASQQEEPQVMEIDNDVPPLRHRRPREEIEEEEEIMGLHAPNRQVVDLSSSPDATTNNDIVDLSNSDENEEEQNYWACPQCTLFNPVTAGRCSACMYANAALRQADPTRRERLIDDDFNIFGPTNRFRHDSNDGIGSVGSGAFLGGVLGGMGAYLRGNSVGNGILGGAVGGAAGGAVLDHVLSSRSQDDDVDSVSSARTAAAIGHPGYPSVNQSRSRRNRGLEDTGAERPRQPRSSFRVQTTGPGGTMTIIRSSGSLGSRRVSSVVFSRMLMGGRGGTSGMRGQNVDGMSYEELLQAFGDGTEHMGASEEAIQALPLAVLQDVEKELPEEAKQCLICLENFSNGEVRKTLPCLHGFHADCCDKWLKMNGSCPICKHSITGDRK